KLWMTRRDPKNSPFPNASNVCLPMLAIACNQFHARSYQAMFTPASFLKTIPIGMADQRRATSVESVMNWQLLYDIEDYEDEFDKLLLGVPINGMGWKKLGWDHDNDRPTTTYVTATDIILPYRTRNMASFRRLTNRLWPHYDELEMRAEKNPDRYLDFDKVKKGSSDMEYQAPLEEQKDENEGEQFDTDEYPNLVLEQCRYYKGKNDKTMAPYICTVDYASETLLRMTSRVVKISGKEAVFQPFIDYHFFPNIEGFYSFGFGHFLEQLNEMANTAFNQIFDSGRLSNQPFGFYGRRAGIKRRELKLWPGRMEEVEDATQVYFPQIQRVDQVLFQVLGLIEQTTQQFTSTGDYLLGRESKGTKTPTASGTLAIIEQGLVLYNTMIKRLYRSLKKEFATLAFLNQINLPEQKQYVILEDPDHLAFPTARRADFDGRMHIVPVGDPSYASKLSRRQEAAEIYSGLLGNPLIVDPVSKKVLEPDVIYEATKVWLETFDRKDIPKLLPEMPQKSQDPVVENAALMQGDIIEISDKDDPIHHLEVHERFKKTAFYSHLPKEGREALDKHIAEHKAQAYELMHAKEGLGASAAPAPALPPMPGGGGPAPAPGVPPPAGAPPAPPPAEVPPPVDTPQEAAITPSGNGV
ncbi:MAG TPA: hypothetical protein VK633_11800, partial [Verrucomicrobiae bacterium]|nr:hypothetical protein [Verrucomicrobiae bacterium]